MERESTKESTRETIAWIAFFGMVVAVFAALIGWVIYDTTYLRTTVTYQSQIKVSSVFVAESPVWHFKTTTIETLGGDELSFYGDYGKDFQSGKIYDITYKYEFHWGIGDFGLWRHFLTIKLIGEIGEPIIP